MAETPDFGTCSVSACETIVRLPRQGAMPKEILRLQEYWLPPVGHIFFVNGHGLEVEEVATFFHLNGGDFNSKVSVIRVKERPEL